MDKQTLRYTYLTYFAGQYAKKENLDFNTLNAMADGNFTLEKDVLKELINENLIEGVTLFEDELGTKIIQNNKALKLTTNGIKEILKLYPDIEIVENQNDFINIDTDKNKSKKDKYSNIKQELLILFADIAQDKQNTKNINNENIKQHINSIIKKYYYKAYPRNKEIVNQLKQDGLINVNYETIKGLNDLKTIINVNGIIYLQKNYNYEFNILDETAKRKLKGSTNVNNLKLQSNITDKVEKNKNNNQFKERTYTFEGILGQNCGDYITVDNSNKDDRLPERIIHEKTGRHFIVKNGIKVLRGFAKASDLYFASEPDKKNYQRDEDDVHLKELSEFISEMNPSGKYLPELTFIARGGYELCRPDWGKKLPATPLGYFKNTNYYQLHLNGTKLYRIDGNHRLEALQKLSVEQKEYYIPFAIILMGKQILLDDTDQVESSLGLEFSGDYGLVDTQDEKKIVDMEAFLFYFLNAKAKRLTTEENYRGLISSDWQKHEIEIANKNIILLQYLNKLLKDNILHNDLCNNEPLKQISEILEKINEDIDLNRFGEIIKIMNNLLATDCWRNLKKFEFYCQLIFYVAYKHEDETECKQILNNLEHWVKKYNFDNTTFDNPILLYNNAQKTNNVDPINIFVAMPFDDIHINNFTEWIKIAIKNIEENKPQYKGRINLYQIMKHRGYNIDLMDDIMEKINNCSIFIAEISPCQYTFKNKPIRCDAVQIFQKFHLIFKRNIEIHMLDPILNRQEKF